MKYNFEHALYFDNTELHFVFSTQYLHPSAIYRVATLDQDLKLYTFLMERDKSGVWKITSPNPPAYLMRLESSLDEAISNA